MSIAGVFQAGSQLHRPIAIAYWTSPNRFGQLSIPK